MEEFRGAASVSNISTEEQFRDHDSYCDDDQSVTQLPSLTSTIFEPVESEGHLQPAAVKSDSEWCYYGQTAIYDASGVNNGKRSEEAAMPADAYYAKVLPCHMW